MRFASLSTRLTVQFAALFALAMLAVIAALSSQITRSTHAQVERELAASSLVYDRLWDQRTSELRDAGTLLAGDFGFREAVATGDEPTMTSALDNLRRRVGVKTAFIVGIDGRVHGLRDTAEATDAAALWDPLDAGRSNGVARLGSATRQLVAAPIMSPVLTGWLVLGADLDRKQLEGLEKLSAIPLTADVLLANGAKWTSASGTYGDLASLPATSARSQATFELDGKAFALTKPLPTFGSTRAVLLLAYPKSLAMAQQRQLLAALAAFTILGLALVLAATWRASGRITRPLVRLDDAARRVAGGEHVEVPVEGDDELARLGTSFNRMVGEIEERERRITHLAFNDTLTGLPNRALFQQHLDLRLRNGLREGEALALHCLDLDHFKSTNDTLGHPAGDALLKEVGKRLESAAQGHFVARLGGDEFVVIQTVGGSREDIDRLARAISEAVAAPLDVDGQIISASTSIGIAVAPDDGETAEALLKNADLALYRAKEAGRGTHTFFEEELNARAQKRRRLESDLRIAIDQGQFEMFYQPLFDLRSGGIASFEALIRWNHPTRGLVSPADFIPVAEETGLIVPIGSWALRESCREAARWPDGVRVAVNVSSVQFHREGLSETVLQALAVSGLAPERLEVEITESIFLEGCEATLSTLHRLRQLGVKIALDDFGTGYSSLSYLQRFPFDKLKIDQSFIRNLITRPGASAVVRAITDLAQALGMETTAEGVEDGAQLEELKHHGCSTVQGYLFAKPMPASEVHKLFDLGARDVA